VKPIIYHTGITSPPEIHSSQFEVLHIPTISVEFNNHHTPQDISEFLKSKPVAIIMSKNAVSGLKNWLEKYNLAMDFFGETPFWTVGEQTHQHLLDELRLESWHPELMTGEGIIQSLVEKHQSRILLISAHAINIIFFTSQFILPEFCVIRNLQLNLPIMRIIFWFVPHLLQLTG